MYFSYTAESLLRKGEDDILLYLRNISLEKYKDKKVITELEAMLANLAKVGEAIPQCGEQQELSSLNTQAHAGVSSFRRRQMKKHEDTKVSQQLEEARVDKKLEEERVDKKLEEARVDQPLKEARVNKKLEKARVDKKLEEARVDKKLEEARVDKKLEEARVDKKLEEARVDKKLEEARVDQQLKEARVDKKLEEARVDKKLEEARVDQQLKDARVDKKLEETRVDKKLEEARVDQQLKEERLDQQLEEARVDHKGGVSVDPRPSSSVDVTSTIIERVAQVAGQEMPERDGRATFGITRDCLQPQAVKPGAKDEEKNVSQTDQAEGGGDLTVKQGFSRELPSTATEGMQGEQPKGKGPRNLGVAPTQFNHIAKSRSGQESQSSIGSSRGCARKQPAVTTSSASP